MRKDKVRVVAVYNGSPDKRFVIGQEYTLDVEMTPLRVIVKDVDSKVHKIYYTKNRYNKDWKIYFVF